MSIEWIKKLIDKDDNKESDKEKKLEGSNDELKNINDQDASDEKEVEDEEEERKRYLAKTPFAIDEWREELKEGNKKKCYYYLGLGREQKRYTIFLPMYNEIYYNSPKKKCIISIETFEENMKIIFAEKFAPKIRLMTSKKISFEDMFNKEEKLALNEDQIIFFIEYIGNIINLLYINQAVSAKKIGIYIDMKKNRYCIYKDVAKIIDIDFNKNILKELYDFFKNEIIDYINLNDEDKIKRILNKYDIRCDFTKKKHSYQITSQHLVLSDSIDKSQLIEYLETKDAQTIMTILKYFIIVVLDKERIYRILSPKLHYKIKEDEKNGSLYVYNYKEETENPCQEQYCFEIERWRMSKPKDFDKFLVGNRIDLTDIDVETFVDLLKPASPRYLINKLKLLDSVEITIKDDIYSFNINLKYPEWNHNILMIIICGGFIRRGRLTPIDGMYYLVSGLERYGELNYNYKYGYVVHDLFF